MLVERSKIEKLSRDMTPSSGSFETVIQSVRWPRPKSIICDKATRGGIERA